MGEAELAMTSNPGIGPISKLTNGAFREALTFDDVLLRPGLSELLPSRLSRSRLFRPEPKHKRLSKAS